MTLLEIPNPSPEPRHLLRDYQHRKFQKFWDKYFGTTQVEHLFMIIYLFIYYFVIIVYNTYYSLITWTVFPSTAFIRLIPPSVSGKRISWSETHVPLNFFAWNRLYVMSRSVTRRSESTDAAKPGKNYLLV
jgi:hypothetical protein